MNAADLIALALIAFLAFGGLRRGLVAGALSLSGLVAGAIIGARVAPDLINASPGARWAPVATLAAAMFCASVGQWVGLALGRWIRRAVTLSPLRLFDAVGGAGLGGATGLVLCWAIASALIYVPSQTGLRSYVTESRILSELTERVPPSRVISQIGRIDPFAELAGPAAGVDPPDLAIVSDLEIRAAREGVVRVRGIACGIGIEGSGWIVEPGVVVTNAHVVAGIARPFVDFGPGGRRGVSAQVVSFDPDNDIAVLAVPGLGGRPLTVARADPGTPGALLGFPEGGGYRATAVRLGKDVTLIANDALGRGLRPRAVTGVRGKVKHGNSGGPVVDPDGRVVTMIFAEREGGGQENGYGVPIERITDAVAAVGQPVATPCGDLS